MMMMTLWLLVCNVAQHNLRSRLKETGETLPNPLEKPVKNPTLRWIFQIMKGLGIVRMQENPDEKLDDLLPYCGYVGDEVPGRARPLLFLADENKSSRAATVLSARPCGAIRSRVQLRTQPRTN